MEKLLIGEELTARDPRQLGRWKVQSRLGFGGMGVVYLARSGQWRAAVKVIRPGLLDDPKMVERFNREVAVLSAVRDIHISQFLDANLKSEPAWLAIEYIPGPTVKEAVTEHGPLPPDQWWALAKGVSQALAVLEVHRVTHRDIKPGNVILSEGRAVLIDFGIAHPEDATSLTQTGLVTGSPAWLSPEQANADATGAPSDVFSLGSLLAYAGTGRPPFGEGVAVAVLMRITSSEPDLAGLAPDQESLVRRMLAKDPGARPTAREVLAVARRAVGEDHPHVGLEADSIAQFDAGATQVIDVADQTSVQQPAPAHEHTAVDRPAASSTAPLPVTPLAPRAEPELTPEPPVEAPATVSPPVVLGPPVTPAVPRTAVPSSPAQPPAPSPLVAQPAPKQPGGSGRKVMVAGLALAAVAALVFVVMNLLGGTGTPSGEPTGQASSESASATQSPTSQPGTAPPAPSSDQLKSGDWLLESYRLVNDASSMSVTGTVRNTGDSAASATITTYIYAGGESIGSVSTQVTDVPAGGSVEVTMTGDAKWQAGQKVLLVQADSA